MNFKLSKQYENLYIECLEKENTELISKLNSYLLDNHVIIYSEEPNIIGKYFLKTQYKSDYVLADKVMNVSVDGDRMDIEFFEAKRDDGNIGHIEFDFLMYPKNKIYYILEEVIEPIVKTGDIGKIIENKNDSYKIIYFRNIDVIISSLSDDKIFNKIKNWLEKYVLNNRFVFTFYNYNNSICNYFKNYCYQIRIPKLNNTSGSITTIIEKWLMENVQIKKDITSNRKINSFFGFKYYMRYIVNEQYYILLYEFMKNIVKNNKEYKKYEIIRDFLIEWLQSGKNHKELINELIYYVGNIKNSKLKMHLIKEINRKSQGLENSKKVMYYLENILSVFI